jgi:hypothetical protein
VYTDIGKNQTFRHIYFIYMHIIVMLLVPFIVLAVLNSLLIRAVKQSERVTGRVPTKQKRENNLTVMLIAIVVVFLACQVPSIVDNICAATLDKKVINSAPFVRLTCISSLMVIINSATNFYLYCVFGCKFRRVFCRIFCIYSVCQPKHMFQPETTLLRDYGSSNKSKSDSKRCPKKNQNNKMHGTGQNHGTQQNRLYPTMSPKSNNSMSLTSSNGHARYTRMADDTQI